SGGDETWRALFYLRFLPGRKEIRSRPFSRLFFSDSSSADLVHFHFRSSPCPPQHQVLSLSQLWRRCAPGPPHHWHSSPVSLAVSEPSSLTRRRLLSSVFEPYCRGARSLRSFTSLRALSIIEEPAVDNVTEVERSTQGAQTPPDLEVLSTRLFSPFDSRLKSPLQASSSQFYKHQTNAWKKERKGPTTVNPNSSSLLSNTRVSTSRPRSSSSTPQFSFNQTPPYSSSCASSSTSFPGDGSLSPLSSSSSLLSSSSSSPLSFPSFSYSPPQQDGQDGDILRREALWWIRHTRQVTVDVVDNWTLSFHFLYKQKQFDVLKGALEDSLHVVPCLRPGEIAMLANHASRLLPLKKAGEGGSSSNNSKATALSQTERVIEEKRTKRWWALFGDSLSHLLHDADGRDISIILNAFSAARVFHHENLMKLLAQEVAAWAPHNSVRNTALILNAMARLKVTDGEAVEGSCLLIQKEAANLNHIDCAMSINAAARLGYRDASFYSTVGDAAVRQSRRMNEHNLSMILWAYGTVGVRHHALLGEAIDQLLRISHSRLVHANYVAPILAAFGSLQFEHPRLGLLIDVLVKPNVERFEPVDNVLVCTALSRLGCRVSITPVAAQLLAIGGRLIANGALRDRPHHALNLAVAAGAMEATGMKSFWDDISEGMAAALKTASSSEIAGAMLPVVKVKGYPAWRPSLLEVAIEAMAAHGPARWSPRDVSNFLFVLGKTDGEIGEDPPDVSAVSEGDGYQTGASLDYQMRSRQTLYCAGGADKRFRTSPAAARRQLIKDMCAYSAKQMSFFNPYDVVRLLQACSVLNYRDEGVLNAVGDRLREAGAAGACDAFPFHVQRSIAAALLKRHLMFALGSGLRAYDPMRQRCRAGKVTSRTGFSASRRFEVGAARQESLEYLRHGGLIVEENLFI
ncbi:hypothetical protein CSUI_004094, partial [Cystoisospora suis]